MVSRLSPDPAPSDGTPASPDPGAPWYDPLLEAWEDPRRRRWVIAGAAGDRRPAPGAADQPPPRRTARSAPLPRPAPDAAPAAPEAQPAPVQPAPAEPAPRPAGARPAGPSCRGPGRAGRAGRALLPATAAARVAACSPPGRWCSKPFLCCWASSGSSPPGWSTRRPPRVRRPGAVGAAHRRLFLSGRRLRLPLDPGRADLRRLRLQSRCHLRRRAPVLGAGIQAGGVILLICLLGLALRGATAAGFRSPRLLALAGARAVPGPRSGGCPSPGLRRATRRDFDSVVRAGSASTMAWRASSRRSPSRWRTPRTLDSDLAMTLDRAASAAAGRPGVPGQRHAPAPRPRPGGRYGPWPSYTPGWSRALGRRGMAASTPHQSAAVGAALDGEDVCVVASTPAGRPSAQPARLENDPGRPRARPVYLFPTKALSQDQYTELHADRDHGADIKTYIYDGDTPITARRAVRLAGTSWSPTRTCCTAECCSTTPSGSASSRTCATSWWTSCTTTCCVFGSHQPTSCAGSAGSAEFYDARPQFICCSASPTPPSWPPASPDGTVTWWTTTARPRRPPLRLLQPAGRQPGAGHPAQRPRRERPPGQPVAEQRRRRRSSSPARGWPPRCC